ncbi:unnamed protein product [Prunus armeniaca]
MTSRLTTPTHGLDCEYCGDPKHTRETCFKLHGYPDWWATLKDRGQRNMTSNGTGYGFHTSAKIDSKSWIIDSGATDHMTFDPDDFLNTTQPRRTCIANANGVTYPVTGAGTVALSSSLTLIFTLRRFLVVVLREGGLYYVDDFSPGMANSVTHPFDSKQKQIWLWHRRLGHPSFSYMKHLIPDLFSGFKDSDFTCDTCILAKSHRVPYPLSTNKCTTPFTLIHSDVWGPSPITAPSGVRWFVTFIDDCTRMTWLYLLKNKNEVFSRFQSFHKQMKTQFNAQIQILRSDNGGEFVNHDFQTYFQQHGIIHETTCPQTPQQNGVAERKNRHLLETARALLIGAHVSRHHWDDAIVTAVHLINRMPSGVLTFKTPLQVLAQHRPLPSVLKGHRCYHPPTRRTYVTLDVTFLESELFFHDPSSNSTLQGEIRSEEQNWSNLENEEILLCTKMIDHPESGAQDYSMPKSDQSPIHSDQLPDSPDPYEDISDTSLTPTDNIEQQDEDPPLTQQYQQTNLLRISLRQNRGKPPNRYSPDIGKTSKYPIANHVSTEKLSEPLKAFVHQLSAIHIPTKVSEALKDPKWVQAIKEEMKALEKNQTWTLETIPRGKKTIRCRWVFTIKHNADGSIERYKARLVAKGYTQTYGIDYEETFAPVAKLNTVRVLLSLAANLDWPLHQFDVKNAFLHGELTEEVYMDIPPGYNTTHTGIVCRLRKALYELKQSPRAWFGRFTMAMKNNGFKQCNSDHTLFLKHQKGKVTALIIYVDDMIITGNNKQEISQLQDYLATEFEMKDLGGLKYFLGIEVARSQQGIFLSQRKYVLDLLTDTGMLDCKPADTPIVQNHHLGEYLDQVPTNKERYQRLVGRLIYLSHTRPDIAYAVSVVSQFMHSPSEDHMNAVLRILRYLKSAPGKGLMFSKHGHLNIDGYSDADWAGNVTYRKSTSGYFTFVGGNLVTWRSKKQNVVALSSAEAEFRGMTKGICELLWLRKLLIELGYKPTSTMNLFCDNKAAIAIAQNPVQHDRTKHVEVDQHFIKQKLEAKVFQFPFVKSEDQLADILTNAISSKAFNNSLDQLGIGDIYAPTMKLYLESCSSIGGGAFKELGSFYPTASNLLFVESPAGEGWLYSNTSSDYKSGDASTARDMHTFLLKWYEKFTFARLLSPRPVIWNRGLTIMNECDFDNYVFPEPQNVTVQCNPAISQANKIVGEYVIVDVCCPSIVQQELRLQKMATKISVGGYVCMTYERRSYLNLSEIQKAVHTNRTNFLIVGVCAVSREFFLARIRLGETPMVLTIDATGILSLLCMLHPKASISARLQSKSRISIPAVFCNFVEAPHSLSQWWLVPLILFTGSGGEVA